MSEGDALAIAVIACAAFAIVGLCCVALCLKLYTEFVKEKKYREP